jgi:hypothetical protein
MPACIVLQATPAFAISMTLPGGTTVNPPMPRHSPAPALVATLPVSGMPAAAATPGTANPSFAGSAAMDLSSTTAAINAAGLLQNNRTVNIRAGGRVQRITTDTPLTPAQYVAVRQVLASGRQNLILDAAGAATGGRFGLNSLQQTMLSSLVIPNKVTGVERAAQRSLDIAGDLSLQGTLLILPGGIRGFSLNVDSLNIAPGGALISKLSTLNINVNSGHVTNAGAINALSGSLTFTAPRAVDLIVDNCGGAISARNNINFRASDCDGSAATQISGGTLSARAINFSGGRAAPSTDLSTELMVSSMFPPAQPPSPRQRER